MATPIETHSSVTIIDTTPQNIKQILVDQKQILKEQKQILKDQKILFQ